MSATTRKLEAGLFGHETELEYSERWVGHSIVIMRVVVGCVLFQGGTTKLMTYLDRTCRTTGRRWAT